MPRFIAYLRAINVGGHTVKMDALRAHFEALGFTRVETFIASGNVIFESSLEDTRQHEKQIEDFLLNALGYPVATFIRTPSELVDIARYVPFSKDKLESAQALNIAFLAEPPAIEAQTRLMSLRSEIDDFHVHGREVYWLCRLKQSQSTFSNAVLEKTFRQPSTLRGIATIQKMAARYGTN